MAKGTWKAFEQLTAKIQRDLAPEAAVTHNERIVGKSGATHQIDVLLRAHVGQLEFVCIIECKDLSKRVGAEHVRAFVTKIADLPVQQGVLVSACGFTSDARKLARQYHVKTYTLINAQRVRWRDEPLLPIVFVSIDLQGADAKFFDLQGNPRSYEPADGTIAAGELKVYDNQAQCTRTLRDTLEYLWDETLDKAVPSPEAQVRTAPGRYSVSLGGNRLEGVIIEASFTPRILYRYNTVSVGACEGFFDEDAGTALPGAYETAPLDIATIIKEWPSTADKTAVPVTPVDFFYLCGFLHRRPRTPRQFTIIRTTGEAPVGAIPI